VSRGIFFTFGEESFGNVSTSTIFVVDVDSRKTIRVTSGDWLDINPVWMPDGRTLLFISGRGGAAMCSVSGSMAPDSLWGSRIGSRPG
jgi:Tol biopolymer transport system component